MAASIIVVELFDINSHQIFTLVFNASIPIGGASLARFNFFCRFLENFLKVPMIGDLHSVEVYLQHSELDILTSRAQFSGAG